MPPIFAVAMDILMRLKSLAIIARLVLPGMMFSGAPLFSGAALADKIKNPTAVFAGLDKITGRIIAFEAAVDETVQFGSLQLTARICYSRPEYENPQTTTFVEVDEVMGENNFKRLFGGWMFAGSPGLNAIEHPVYDVWLTDCKGGRDIIKTPAEVDEDHPAPVSELKKLPPKPAQPIQPRSSATSAPLRLPGADGLPSGTGPIPPGNVQPRAQPQQRFFPTNPAPNRGGLTYDPGPKN